jgi:hypothetical protein
MIKSFDLLIFLEKINFSSRFSIRYFINSFHHFNLSLSLHLSFNKFSQSSISMLRLIASDWSNEWCQSDEIVSKILHVFVETAFWWNRLLTFLQSNINSHWVDSFESFVLINVYEYQHVSTSCQTSTFFFQHAKNLTIVATYVQFFHRIVLNWLEKSFSSDCLCRDST